MRSERSSGPRSVHSSFLATDVGSRASKPIKDSDEAKPSIHFSPKTIDTQERRAKKICFKDNEKKKRCGRR